MTAARRTPVEQAAGEEAPRDPLPVRLGKRSRLLDGLARDEEALATAYAAPVLQAITSTAAARKPKDPLVKSLVALLRGFTPWRGEFRTCLRGANPQLHAFVVDAVSATLLGSFDSVPFSAGPECRAFLSARGGSALLTEPSADVVAFVAAREFVCRLFSTDVVGAVGSHFLEASLEMADTLRASFYELKEMRDSEVKLLKKRQACLEVDLPRTGVAQGPVDIPAPTELREAADAALRARFLGNEGERAEMARRMAATLWYCPTCDRIANLTDRGANGLDRVFLKPSRFPAAFVCDVCHTDTQPFDLRGRILRPRQCGELYTVSPCCGMIRLASQLCANITGDLACPSCV